jgi:hypothetical protein
MSSFIQNLRFSDRETSEVSADLGQPPYENDTFVETFTETKSCAIGKDGIRINYDLDTISPKYFEMTKDGVVFQETGTTYTTGLGRLCAVQQAFQAVELPPNATTLKIDNTILLDDGSGITNTISNFQTALVESSVGSTNQIIQEVNAGGANFFLGASNLSVPTSHSVRMEVPLGSNAIIEHIELGTSNTKNLAISSTGNLLFTADNLLTTASNFNISSSATGGAGNPLLTLTNTNATGSVALEVYKNKPTAGVNGDVLFNQSVYGKDSGNAKQEYTRITHTIRDITAGAEDGSIEMGCMVNGSFNNFLQINGNQNEVNCLKNLDMGGHSIRTSVGDIIIDAGAGVGSVNAIGTALNFNTINIMPRFTYNTFAFSVLGSPSSTILNFGALNDMTAGTTWKVDVGFYTGDGVNNRSILTYVVQDTLNVYVEQNSVFGYTQGGLQTPITYDPVGTPMGKYCSFTDTFLVNPIAVGGCSFILTGGTSDSSTWSGTCRVSIVLTRLG